MNIITILFLKYEFDVNPEKNKNFAKFHNKKLKESKLGYT
jgi:hypothetical protein